MRALRSLTHRGTAYFQATMSAVFLVGYFHTLGLFISGAIKAPPEWKDAITVLLGVLTTSVTTIMQFWFSRQRVSESPTGSQPS